MAEPAELCPKCNAESVVFDYLEGLSVCESCGAVVEESQLVQHVTEFGDNDSGPTRLGVFVRDCDTGAVAGAALLPRTGTGLRIQQSHWHQGQVPKCTPLTFCHTAAGQFLATLVRLNSSPSKSRPDTSSCHHPTPGRPPSCPAV